MSRRISWIAQTRSDSQGTEPAGDPVPRAADHASLPHILFVSHCVPNPPEKGEKIRSFHLIHYLAKRYQVHLVCFAHNQLELKDAEELRAICSSIYVQQLPVSRAIRGGVRLLLGGCLNAGYYWSAHMKRHVDRLARQVELSATLVSTCVMMPYGPDRVPKLLDMQDVDSEKWFAYAHTRTPGFLYALEAKRLRLFETASARASERTILTTRNEEMLLRSIAPGVRTTYMENGVDVDYFDGKSHRLPAEFDGRRFIVFIGTMNYYPNVDGACWFATRIFPELRRRDRDLEFLVIGRRPVKAVQKLGSIDGVTVTGGVPDIRPFIAGARAVVAPLRMARGIQNKVIEALVMGRKVHVTEAVWRTLGTQIPTGIVLCDSEQEFTSQLERECKLTPKCEPEIRRAACERFTWPHNLQIVGRELDEIIRRCGPVTRDLEEVKYHE